MWKSLGIVVCAFAASTASAEIYRCQKDKSEVYQNFPCHIDSIGSTATAAPPTDRGAAAPRSVNGSAPNQPLPIQNTQASTGAAAAAPVTRNGEKYEPRIGMTRRQVRRLSWGEPEDIARTDEGEYVWTYPDKRVLRFDDKGRLISVQR